MPQQEQMYPFNFIQSKLYPWYLKRTIETANNMFMLPKLVLDTYISTFKQVYNA